MSGGNPGHFPFTRREFLKTAGAAAILPVAPAFSLAANPAGTPLHGLSAFGNLGYAPGFGHFGYASPEAPKGGRFAFSPSYWYFNQNTQTFNTLNSFLLKGEAPPRMELCFDTLMVAAWDEPDALYCSLSESVEISADRNTYRFVLRPEARFHDGSTVTAADVAWSYMTLKEKGHPQLAVDLSDLAEAVAVSEHVVELRFSGRQSDRAILNVANSVPILSSAFAGRIPFEEQVMEIPPGSGPWKVSRFDAGIFIEYERDAGYWAQNLPFARGLDHFDVLRIDFFQERQAAFEAFKKGEIRWRAEFTAKTWATEYDFPAVGHGAVRLVEMPGETRPGLQGWAVNTRKEKFADARTRQAIGLAFDFEWTNRTLFYDAYRRSHSLFERSDFAAEGLPSQAELALLEPLRSGLPGEVFGEAVRQHESDGSGRDRRALRQAGELLEAAGWQRAGGRLVNSEGGVLEIEFLIRAQVFERILAPFVENLRLLGIDATIRQVDPSQFQSRLDTFDFDVAGLAFSFGPTPTRETLTTYFHSSTADRQGSSNFPGIRLEAADRLIDAAGKARDRTELATAIKALDRVLRAHHFWIPNWHSANHRIATWDMFGWREPKPDYFYPVERLWWFDAERARAAGIDP